MQELDDITLLHEYVEHSSEEAFAEIVRRHVNKVYSVALRHTHNPHQAEEITQAVFVILARKAGSLPSSVVLSGWLYLTARLTAVTLIKSEIRRARREQESYMQTSLNETESTFWPQIAPVLDAAIAALNERERHAVILRFFDGRSMKEIGAILGGSEDAAKMRVKRAVEKLRRFFAKRGVVLPAAALTIAISGNSVQAAPALLAKTTTAIALAKGATAAGSILALVEGTLKMMAWLKAKTAILMGAVFIIVADLTMRELRLQETLYLSFGLLLCLVLPIMMSIHAPSDIAVRKTCGRIVWTGQTVLMIAGLVILVSEAAALYAIALGSICYLACVIALRRKFRATQTAAFKI
jgi:RNA polymerase sigma factor (sigma-70 family)